MAKNEDRKGVLPQIIVAVVVALLVGGTSPWWWNEIFHSNRSNVVHPSNQTTPVNPPQPRQTIIGGPIVVTVTANPPVVSPGQPTLVNVYVQDSQGQSLPAAVVTLSSGGGRFDRSGTATVSGATDPAGVFQAYWSCAACAPAYVNSVRVTKPGYEEATAQWRVEIR